MIGLRFVFHVLFSMGEEDLALRLIEDERRTGYGSWIKMGATALLENFPLDNGYDTQSQNHHFLGDIVSLMIQEIAGVSPNPTAKDVSSFAVTPHFPTKLTHAEAWFDAPAGRLFAAWKREDGQVILTVNVPAGMHGTVHLPQGWEAELPAELSAGMYTFICKNN